MIIRNNTDNDHNDNDDNNNDNDDDNDSNMQAINWEVMRQIESFSPQGLANVTWGLSAMEYRDIKVDLSFIKAVV